MTPAPRSSKVAANILSAVILAGVGYWYFNHTQAGSGRRTDDSPSWSPPSEYRLALDASWTAKMPIGSDPSLVTYDLATGYTGRADITVIREPRTSTVTVASNARDTAHTDSILGTVHISTKSVCGRDGRIVRASSAAEGLNDNVIVPDGNWIYTFDLSYSADEAHDPHVVAATHAVENVCFRS